MNLDKDIENSEAYKNQFGTFPEMPYRMPMSEFNELIEKALRSGEPINTTFDPDEVS